MQNSLIEQEVRTLAHRSHTHGLNFYALTDGALQRSALRQTKAFARPCSLVPIGGVIARSDLSALPFLVELSEPELRHRNRLITELSAWAIDHSAVTWLESRLPVAALAEQLALRLEAELQQSLSVVLRFADARVLPVLYDTFDDEQRNQFFSCMTNWWYVSRRDELRALPLHHEPGANASSFKPPLQLTAAQEHQLIDAAEPDSVMQILRRHDAEALDKITPSEQYDFVKASIRRARAWSVETPSDLALFCMMALEHGPAFDELTNWKAALTNLRAGKITLIRVVQQQATPA